MNGSNPFRISTSEEKTITNERRSIMLTEQTIDKLYSMKLTGMAESFKEQLQQPPPNPLPFEGRLGLLVDRQWTWKEDCRVKRLLEEAKLKINACMEDIDYKSPRGIDRSVIMTLSSCDWIKKHHNVIITGPTGAGKTFLACALANKACREGYRTFYIRSPKLYYELAVSRGDGSYGKMINKLAKTNILLLDRLIHNAHKINLKGGSMRKKHSGLT